MDIIDLRSALTVVVFVVFIGIVVWAFGRKRKRDFDEAARLPFTGGDDEARSTASGKKR